MRTLQNSLKTGSATVILFIIGLLTSVRTWAQDKAIDVNVNTGGGDAWYGQWWVWVVGIALFVIILVAIVSASKKT